MWYTSKRALSSSPRRLVCCLRHAANFLHVAETPDPNDHSSDTSADATSCSQTSTERSH